MKVSHVSGYYHVPGNKEKNYQGFVLESECPESYRRLNEKIEKMNPDTPCSNVSLHYSLETQQRGYPREERVSFRCSAMTPRQLLEMVKCVTPNATSLPSSEKAQKCLERICPSISGTGL